MQSLNSNTLPLSHSHTLSVFSPQPNPPWSFSPTYHKLHLLRHHPSPAPPKFFLVILHCHHRLIHRFLVLIFSLLLPSGFIDLRAFNQPHQIDKFHKDSSHFLLPMLRYVSKKTIPLKPITIPKPSHHSNSNAAKKLAF